MKAIKKLLKHDNKFDELIYVQPNRLIIKNNLGTLISCWGYQKTTKTKNLIQTNLIYSFICV